MLHNTSKYKQIVNFVLSGINDGSLAKGSWLPSINEFREMFNLSRDTVFAGIAELKSKGVIESYPGRGYCVSTSRVKVDHNILLLFNEMNSFMQKLYNSLIEGLGSDDNVDIQFHNYNRRVFETLLRDANGRYDTFVLMPGKFKGLEPLLRSLDGRVLLLDHCHQELREKFCNVVQNFEHDTYNALVSGERQLSRYTSYYMIQSEMKEPTERYIGMRRYCRERGLRHKYLTAMSIAKIHDGDLFVVANDSDMVDLLKLAMKQGYVPGREFGVISFNDTPLKEILAGGITTLSTDFLQMGRTMARLISRRDLESVDNPWKLEIRASI